MASAVALLLLAFLHSYARTTKQSILSPYATGRCMQEARSDHYYELIITVLNIKQFNIQLNIIQLE